MDKTEAYVVKSCIKEIENVNIEQKWLIFKSFIETYIASLITFGNNDVTKDAHKMLKQFRKIEDEELKIYKFIIKNIKQIDFNKCIEFLYLLEDLNEKTIIYYLNSFSDIQSACEIKNEIYAKHSKRNFETLIETDEYRCIAVGLTISEEEIKKFLNYPTEFWKFVKTKITYVDSTKEGNEFFYSTLMKFDTNNNLIDIKVLIPRIIDLKTSLVNIHELKHAYDLYQLLGKEVDENNPIYEESAIKKEQEFKKQYIKKKFYK